MDANVGGGTVGLLPLDPLDVDPEVKGWLKCQNKRLKTKEKFIKSLLKEASLLAIMGPTGLEISL